jgi:uncharacterized protein
MKYLLWGLLIAAVVLWVLRAKKALRDERDQQHRTMAKETPPIAEPMLQCAHCGVHLPASEALVGKDGQAFCSGEHLRLHDEA